MGKIVPIVNKSQFLKNLEKSKNKLQIHGFFYWFRIPKDLRMINQICIHFDHQDFLPIMWTIVIPAHEKRRSTFPMKREGRRFPWKERVDVSHEKKGSTFPMKRVGQHFPWKERVDIPHEKKGSTFLMKREGRHFPWKQGTTFPMERKGRHFRWKDMVDISHGKRRSTFLICISSKGGDSQVRSDYVAKTVLQLVVGCN